MSDEVVARIDVIEEEGEDRIECEEERDWTQGISLEDSPFEREWIGVPGWSGDNGLGIFVDILNVILHWIREIVSLEGVPDQVVWNAPKGVGQIEKGDMESSFPNSRILYDLVKNDVMFYAAVDTREESLLYSWINESIGEEVAGDPLGKNEMVGLTDCTSKCNHPKVGRIVSWTLLMDQLDEAL